MPARDLTLRDWLRENPPPPEAFTQSLAGVARRVRDGEDFRIAVRELLDELNVMPGTGLRQRAIDDRPAATGNQRFDAFLGGLAEHLAVTGELARPPWCTESNRFLDRFWFWSDVPGFRPLQIAESPAAFRRRGIFIAEGALHRV